MIRDRASTTARLIAAATVMRRDAPEHGGAPPTGAAPWCERFLSTTRTDRSLLWSVRSAPGRALWRFVESMAVPGIVSHWMRRKRALDRLARQAAAEGFTQLIVLGAGLDALAFRLDQERVYGRVLSADHPATLAVVRTATAHAATSRCVELIALDLVREDACDVLIAANTFEATRDTVVVIEGVLMYLSESAVAALLRSLARLPTPRVRLIASWMIAEPGQPIGFAGQSRLVPAWLRRRSEPMLWGSTPAALPAFLAGLGWINSRSIDLAEDERAHGEVAGGLRSELLVLVERREPS